MSEPDSKKQHRNWLPVALLTGFVVYLASFGPACWLLPVNHQLATPCNIVYAPVVWVGLHGPEPVRNSVLRFANLGVHQGQVFLWGNQLLYRRFPVFL